MSNNKPEICAEEIRVAPNPNSNVIRTPLSAFGRYQLEKQFNQQVPEYRNVGSMKHNVMLGSYALSAVSAVGLAIGATQRSYRPLAGIVAGGIAFVFTKALSQNAFYFPGFKNELQLREYNRAFNVWLFYKEQNETANLPVRSMEKRYQQKLAVFKQTNQL